MLAISGIRAAAVGCAFALGIWSFSGPAVSAAVLTPGGGPTPVAGTYSIAGEGLPVATFTQSLNETRHGLAFDFSLTATVYLNPTTHGDDFVYQLTNTGPNDAHSDSFNRMTVSSFLGYSVDADYASNTGTVQLDSPNPSDNSATTAGDVAPDEVDLSANGAVVGYGFALDDLVGPQEVTDELIVRTNSTTYTMGTAEVLDNENGMVLTSVPFGAVVVPEPTSLALIVVSLGMLARRRSGY
jgi:hypothetical protein